MINKVILAGRLTKEPELRKTQNNKSVLGFTIACNRPYKDENGNSKADFPNCIAFNQSAEFLAGYAHQGDLIGVEGSIQTRSYEGQNGTVYVTEILCERVCILSRKLNEEIKNVKPVVNYDQTPSYKVNGEKQDIGFDIDVDPNDLPFY